MNERDADGMDRLAGEYALGTLRGHARRRFERLMAHDPAAAARVAAWETRLQPLANSVAPVAPDPLTWTRIEQSLDHAGRESRPAGLRAFLFALPHTPIPSIATAGLWYCVRFWRSLGIAAALAAIVLAAILIGGPARGPGIDAPMVAVLEMDGAPAALLVEYDPQSREFRLRPLQAPTPAAGEDFELWLVAPDAAPQSLGLITDPGQRYALPPDHDTLPEGSMLAVSVEPSGGSTTGQPTGPVILAGTFHPIDAP